MAKNIAWRICHPRKLPRADRSTSFVRRLN
jgi:hypothetical protein